MSHLEELFLRIGELLGLVGKFLERKARKTVVPQDNWESISTMLNGRDFGL
jgi:hypothetical protein